MVKGNKNEGEKMKKFLIVLMTCFLIVSWGLTQNQKRTKEIYRGSKDRPTIKIWFFDDPEQGTKGWMARMVVYENLGQVGGLEYLTEKQRQAKDTIIVELRHLFDPSEPNKEVVSLSICSADEYDETNKMRWYRRIKLTDANLDGIPDKGSMGCFRDPYETKYLLFLHEITEGDVSFFKLSKKQFNYKKIEKEFQKWLKENKQ